MPDDLPKQGQWVGGSSPWHHFYNTSAWKERRAWKLRQNPLCERCLKNNLVVPATTVHHIIRHQGNWELFITGELSSSCKPCHDTIEQSIERLGYSKEIGLDGWPVDDNHPVNKKVK